jgi:hypothetical protein
LSLFCLPLARNVKIDDGAFRVLHVVKKGFVKEKEEEKES